MMIRATKSIVKTGHVAARNFSKLMVATEAFPYDVTVSPAPSAPAVIAEATLENGIKLITREVNAPLVTLKFAIFGGSGAETESQKGAAQLLATAAFQGNGDVSGLRIVRALESLGATIASSVDKEKIVYDVTVSPEGAQEALDIVMRSIASPPYAEYVLDELKPDAQLAYDLYSTDYSSQVSEMLYEAAYGEESTLGASVYGNLKKLSVSDVLAYRAKTFVSENIVITANGLSTAALESMIAASADVPTASSPPSSVACPYVGGDYKVRKDLNGNSYLGLAFPTPTGEAAKPYMVLQGMLESKCTSSFLSSYSSGGLLGIVAKGTPTEATSMLEAAISDLKAVASGSAAEVDVIKKKVALTKMLALEESPAVALMSASTQGAAAATIADCRTVSSADVSAAAAAVLSAVPSYVVLGKTAGTPTYAAIAALVK